MHIKNLFYSSLKFVTELFILVLRITIIWYDIYNESGNFSILKKIYDNIYTSFIS